MLKKLLLIAAGAALLAALFFGRSAVSYVGTAVSSIHQSVKDNVPIEFEIQRARRMIVNLVPEIRRNMHLIAKEEVDVQRLAKQVEKLEARQEKDREGVMTLKADLESGSGSFYYAGHRYSEAQVKIDLANRFERFKTNDGTLAKLQKVLNAREHSLQAARAKLDGMLAAKRQLEVDVENLEARLKMVEVAQTTSDFNFDNSHLARTKDLITDIQTRIDVAERLVHAETDFQYEIPLDTPSDAEDISDQITEYFGEERPDVASVAEALK